MTEVWHVRHGERCDEVSGAERRGWQTSKVFGQGRGYYDSPLTRYGHVQASRAGLYIKSVLPCDREPDGDSSGLLFDRVYTSPLMRAVQTAVCVSQALGNLPLQVVPGLGSCTAALTRLGYARVKLLTDADIVAIFPEVNLLPRDPLAPTSFHGAQAWLAARPDRRVLAVGHREGTKAMVGRPVPTPHCCIGIFNVDPADKTYSLRHLLSLVGEPLVSKRSSSVAAAAPGPSPPPPRQQQQQQQQQQQSPRQQRGDAPTAAADDETAKAIAAHVIALSNTTRYNGSYNSRSVKPAKPRRSDSGAAAALGPRAPEDTQGRTTKARAASDRTARDRLRWLLLGARAKATSRKPRSSAGTPPTSSTTGVLTGGAGGNSPAVGGIGINGASGAANVTNSESGGRSLPTRRSLRNTGGADRTANGCSHASSEVAAAAMHAKAVDAVIGDGTARSPAVAAAAADTATSNGDAVDRGGRGKSLASAVASPARGGCAGRGFRVAALSRRSVSGASSANAWRLGVAVDVLSGPMGVLSFLSPFELCAAQAVCKDIALTATGERLWTDLFSLLPGRRRCRKEEITPRGRLMTEGAEGAMGSSKALFVREVSARAALHASQVAGHVARSKQKSTAIYCLRRSVDKIRMKLSVRLNGKPANLVDSRGSRPQGWASRANLLTEPSSCGGVRRFSLSSSVKVEVPEGLAPSRVLPSLSLAWSWEMAWSPLVPMVRTDRPLLLSEARLLGTDTHGGVALYEITGLDGPGARKGGGGGGGGRGFGASGGRGGREDDNSVLRPTKRACALLGVFDDAEQAGQCPSGRVAFLSVHFPHDLLIDAATGRLTSEHPPGIPRFDENESVFSVALGLRTAGCPLWEKESKNVSARRCSRYGATCLRRRGFSGEGEGRPVVRVDLVRPGENEGKELTLSGDLALPYSTSGGLYGAVEDVLLADFALCDSDGVTVWAFASPIVFEASSEAVGNGTEVSGGGGSNEDDAIIDIAYSEVRMERRRGIVVEPGVGRVIVELALVVEFEGSGIRGKAAIRNNRFPSKHVWVVRVARAELEPSFVTAWMGQDAGE